MPYINVKTTKTVTAAQCENVKASLGKAIECFPGKSEAYLMVSIDDGAKLWFRGDATQDTAVVDVELLGSVDSSGSERMTAEICRILENELGISPERVYVKYTGYANWGWNNRNF